jgi:alanine racemase
MTLRLTVRRPAWRSHIARYAGEVDGLVPVVKGNGYGFGRDALFPIAAELGEHVCVGSAHEAVGVPEPLTPVVLTPTLRPPADTRAVLTIGAPAHVEALHGWTGRVLVKLRSSMHRHGVEPAHRRALAESARAAGLDHVGYSLHLPLEGNDTDRAAEVRAWLTQLEPCELWLSHLQPATFTALQHEFGRHTLRLRAGTALWHGDKSALQLRADVIDTHEVRAGDTAGYRLTPIPADGTLVVVGAGSAHGVVALDDGRSPFHFERQRLALLEPPHMHVSLCVVPGGSATPTIGDWVDVQRPLIMTAVDEVVWLT